jgi:L-lactate dehydrogenase complex protein LldE
MKASLFITCLIDQFAPQVGISMTRVLRKLGVEVDFPQAQTCCGQPGYNSGFKADARRLAERFLDIFEHSEYIVAPSGSCTSMVRVFYTDLFKENPVNLARAESIAARTYEFTEFLVKVLNVRDVGAVHKGTVALHKSCHLLRELKVDNEPRLLLEAVKGADIVELEDADVCCGFGGLFAVKYPYISGGIMQDKIDCIKKSGAETVVACDAGCLMHIAGGLSRQHEEVRTMHIAELLDSSGTN